MKNKGTAAILAFFLGGIGIHQFYLGNSGKGIFYLLFCWTFIPAIIAFIDFILLLTMSEATFNAKYNAPNQFNINIQNNISHPNSGSNVNAHVNTNTNKTVDELTAKAIAHYKAADYDAAQALINRALIINPNNDKLYYNLCCIYCMKKDIENCLKNLQLAIEKGYSDFNKLNTVEDLEWMRQQDLYKQFVKNGYHLSNADHSGSTHIVDYGVLEKLLELKQKGVLTDEEFQKQKSRILK